MGLYWNELEIKPGMMLEVDTLQAEVFNKSGHPAVLWWKIIAFGSRTKDDSYIDWEKGKKFPLKKVVKKKRLQLRIQRGELLQLPSGNEFVIVQVYHDGEEAYKQCYNLDMLHTIRNIKIIKGA